MRVGAKYLHTNLVARDWVRLGRFYTDVFGCEIVPPERDLVGSEFDKGVGISGARAKGAHFRLPGVGPDGPTLEIFEYESVAPEGERKINRPGFAHIAFSVPSVEEARREVVAAGGSIVGETVTTTIATGQKITWCYATDIEGNIVELQSSSDSLGAG